MNIINSSNECDICMSNRQSNTFKCNTCSNSICVSCFCKISQDYHCDQSNKSILSFQCPFCRVKKNYGFVNFSGSEVIYLATQHLKTATRIIKEKNDIIDALNKEIKSYDDDYNIKKQNENIEIIHLKNQIFTFKHALNNIKTKTITTTKLQRMILT